MAHSSPILIFLPIFWFVRPTLFSLLPFFVSEFLFLNETFLLIVKRVYFILINVAILFCLSKLRALVLLMMSPSPPVAPAAGLSFI